MEIILIDTEQQITLSMEVDPFTTLSECIHGLIELNPNTCVWFEQTNLNIIILTNCYGTCKKNILNDSFTLKPNNFYSTRVYQDIVNPFIKT